MKDSFKRTAFSACPPAEARCGSYTMQTHRLIDSA